MMSKKGSFIVWALVALGIFGPPPALWAGRGNPGEKKTNLGEQVLDKAAAYLHSKQSADGAWRSETYGLLKSGQSLTPFVLFALTDSTTGKGRLNEGSIRNALGFLRAGIDSNGVLGRADPDFLDYPNYSTAYALRSFLRFGNEDDRARIENDKLLGSPTILRRGRFQAKFSRLRRLGFRNRRAPTLSSFVDLSHTRRVLVPCSSEAGQPEGSMAGRTLSRPFAKKPQEKRSPLSLAPSGKPDDLPMTAGSSPRPPSPMPTKGEPESTQRPDMLFIGVTPLQPVTESFSARPRDRQDRPPHHFRRPMAEGS